MSFLLLKNDDEKFFIIKNYQIPLYTSTVAFEEKYISIEQKLFITFYKLNIDIK